MVFPNKLNQCVTLIYQKINTYSMNHYTLCCCVDLTVYIRLRTKGKIFPPRINHLLQTVPSPDKH